MSDPSPKSPSHETDHAEKMARYVASICEATKNATVTDTEPCEVCMAEALMLGAATLYADMSRGMPERIAMSVAKFATALAQATEVIQKETQNKLNEEIKEGIRAVFAVIHHQQVPEKERN